MNRSIVYKNSSLHYKVLGTGSKALLMFHGFGQDCTIYTTAPVGLLQVYKIYTFDLYYHGQSVWMPGELPLEKTMWQEILTLFLNAEHIDKFSLAGFSLGARFALASLQSFPERVQGLFLIAPDGIRVNLWYKLATRLKISRRFFRGMIVDHKRFLKIINAVRSLTLIDNRLLVFAEGQMNTPDKRARVYYSWVVFRKLSLPPSELIPLLEKHDTPTIFIMGKTDYLIDSSLPNTFVKRLKNCKVEVLETSHRGLINAGLIVIQKAGF